MPLYTDYHFGGIGVLGLSSGYSGPPGSGYTSTGSSYSSPSYGYTQPSTFSPSFSGYSRGLSSVGSYSNPPVRSTFAAINRHYKPMLTTISESSYQTARRPGHSALTSLTRINSPKIHLHHSSYNAPRPIQMNTADIDVSSSRYNDRGRSVVDTATTKSKTPERIVYGSPSKETSPSESPFMPRVDQHDQPNRSTIKRDRNIVRLSTMRVRSRSKSKSRGEIKIALERKDSTEKRSVEYSPPPSPSYTFQHSPSPEKPGKSSWRDRFGDDLLHKPKETVRKSPGEMILEKHIIRDRSRHEALLAAERREYSARKSRKTSLSKCPTFKDICKDISADIRKDDDLNATELRQRRASLIMEDEQQILAELTRNVSSELVDGGSVPAEEQPPMVMVRKSRRKSTNLPSRIVVHPALVEEQAAPAEGSSAAVLSSTEPQRGDVSPPKWKAVVEHVDEDHHAHHVFKLPKKKVKAKDKVVKVKTDAAETADSLSPSSVANDQLQRSVSGEDFWGTIGKRETVYYDERKRQQLVKEMERKELEQAELLAKAEELENNRKLLEEDARKKQEALDAKLKVEEEKRRKKQEELEAKLKIEADARKKKEDDARKKEEELRRKEEAARKRAEEQKKREEETKRKEEEAKKLQEEVKRKEAEQRAVAEEQRKKDEETKRIKDEEMMKRVSDMDAQFAKIDAMLKASAAKEMEVNENKLEEETTPKKVIPKTKLSTDKSIESTSEINVKPNIETKKPKPLTLTPSTELGPASPKTKLRKTKSTSPNTDDSSDQPGQLSPVKLRKVKSISPSCDDPNAPISPKSPKTAKSPATLSPKKKIVKKKPVPADASPIETTNVQVARKLKVTYGQKTQNAAASTTPIDDATVSPIDSAATSSNTAATCANKITTNCALAAADALPDIEKKIMKNDAADAVNVAEKSTPTTSTTTTTTTATQSSQSVATKIDTTAGNAAKSPEAQKQPSKAAHSQPKTSQQQLSPITQLANASTNNPVKGLTAPLATTITTAATSTTTVTNTRAASNTTTTPPITGNNVDAKKATATTTTTTTQTGVSDVTTDKRSGAAPPSDVATAPVSRSVVPIVGTKKPIVTITSKMPASLKAKLDAVERAKRQTDQASTDTSSSSAAETTATAPPAAAGLSKFSSATLANLSSPPVDRDQQPAAPRRPSSAASKQSKSSSHRSRRRNGTTGDDDSYCLSGEESEIWSVNYSASEYSGSDDGSGTEDEMGLKTKRQKLRDRKKKAAAANFDPKKVVKLDTKRKCYVVEEAPKYPMIATPRPLQKRWHYFSESDSEGNSDEESGSSSESESESDSDSGTDDGCFGNVQLLPGERSGSVEPDAPADGTSGGESTVRMSTCSNDSGFEGGTAPASPKKMLECDINCHKKCEKLTANLCGVNQKLIVEALLSVRRGVREDRESPSIPPSQNPAYKLDHHSAQNDSDESSYTFAQYQRSGRITAPATTIPRFKKYAVEDFHFLTVLGKGSFGKVLLAELRNTEYYYAVKCLKKDVVLEDDDVECTLIERKVLALGTNHPYLCHLFCTFQTESHLFFVMEYLNGGDLMFHIQVSGRFPEPRAKFYGAEIISGLRFLHRKGIIYRDLKLDNILLDFDGHVRIADFGMCKLQIYLDRTADSFCGTPDYMAPEVIKGQNYNQAVDWWSFGVLLYEMLIGQSPFSGCDEDELFWSICNEVPWYPFYISQDALNILSKLMEKDASQRMGAPNCPHEDIADNPFFHEIDWKKLERRQLEPPFKPQVKHPLDTQYFDRAFTRERVRLTPIDKEILRSMDQKQFQGFTYTNPNATPS